MKIAEYIGKFMVEHGVTTNFTVTGGGAMHLNNAFGHQEGLKCIYNHNEQGCAVAAESYARLTGDIALVCVTSGPGGTNAITGVMGGWLDSIPMFVVSGQVKRETTLWSVPNLNLRQLGDQEFNIVDSVSCMTKYAVMLTDETEVAYHLEKAWFLANNGRKGPVWIDVPLDIQGAPMDESKQKHFDPVAEGYVVEPSRVPSSDIQSVLKKITEAKAPLIFAGSGVRISDSTELLLEVVDKLKVPVAVAWNSGDLVAYDNPYYAGSPSREGTRGSSFIVQNCDLILVLGSRMSIRTITYNKNDFARNAYKIMLDIDGEELKKPTFIPDMPLEGDIHAFLQDLLAQIEDKEAPVGDHEVWRSWCRMMVEKYPAMLPEYHSDSKDKLLNPYVFVNEVFEQMNESDVLTLGNGSACVMSFAGAKIKQGQRMYTNAGCAAMGYGMPAALGAAVARAEDYRKAMLVTAACAEDYAKNVGAVSAEEECDYGTDAENLRKGCKARGTSVEPASDRVICIDGDGSIMMNIQELMTISHNMLNVKIFVLNNNGYHSIRQTQRNLMKPPYVGIDEETGVGFPNWDELARAFKFKYFEVDNEVEVAGTVKDVLESEGPALCNVVVDPEQNFVPKLSSKVLPDGRIVSPSMDDMFPFLPREEYEGNRFFG